MVRRTRNIIGLILLLVIPFAGIAQDTLDVGEVRIIAKGLYQTLHDTVTHHDSTTTVIKNDLPVIKDVIWQHEKMIGGSYNLFHFSGISYSDSLEFEWQGDSLKKKTIRPAGGFSFTVKTKYLGKVNIILRGHDSLWTVERRITLNTAYLDTLGGQTSITDVEVMALADTPYERFPWDGITVISNDQADYVGYIPLSLLSQQWWDEVENADAGKFRVAKDDAPDNDTSATELAFEIVDLDTVNQTGQLCFRWSGTLPATSPDELRIYASQDSYTSYGVTDTFGRNAVWSAGNNITVYHQEESADGTAGEYIDSGPNGYHATGIGDIPAQIAGKIGNGQDYAGDVGLSFTSSNSLSNTQYTASLWMNPQAVHDNSNEAMVWGFEDASSLMATGIRYNNAGEVYAEARNTGFAIGTTSAYALPSLTSWHLVHAVADGSTLRLYVNGVERATASFSGTPRWDGNFNLGDSGSSSRRYNGYGDEARAYFNTALSADYIALEYANQNDPATFWGTPTFVAAGGGGTSISGTAALTDNPELAALGGSLALAGQASAVDNPEALAGLGSVSISASVAIVDNPEAISSDLALMLAGSSSMTGRPELASLAGTLSLAASGALTDNAESAQLQAVLLLSGSGALQDNPEQLSITGSFGDIIRGSASLVDNAESVGATGRLIIGGAGAIDDAPANMSINGTLLLAAQAALEDSEQSFQALCDVILSMSIALTDNPEQLLARQLVISDKVKIQVTGQRVGNTITISGERVDGPALVSGPKVSPKTTVN